MSADTLSGMARLADIFASARKDARSVLVAYVTSGSPSLEETRQAVDILVAQGVDIVELGVPFSDPVADGPTIQLASERALEQGVTLADVFQLAREIRAAHPQVGLVLMGYANPFYTYGLREAAEATGAAGVDGWIVPDVPFEESWRFREFLSMAGAAFIPLLAPTTSTARAVNIAQESGAPFVYYVAVTGVTGERKSFESGWHEPLDALRQATDVPVVIGFGISDGDSARQAASHADGVVVGSALVRRIGDISGAELTAFVKELREAV